MKYIEAVFKTKSEEIDGLCLELTDMGADGMVIEDEKDFKKFLAENKQYWDYVDEELEERFKGVSRIKLYVPEDGEGRKTLALYTERLGREPELRIVDETDWQDKWKEYYKPIEVGERLLVIPKWDEIPKTGRAVLRLDPGLAFGTGNHATTRMCLREIEKYAAPEKFVLDLGCGSGILGIAALILGCAFVSGCDVDPKAADVAKENAKLNGIGDMVFQPLTGDVIKDRKLREDLGSGYDIVLANIVADVIIPLAPHVKKFMSPKGVFICSGIIEGRQDEVRGALEICGFKVEDALTEDGWHCFAAKL